MPALHSFSSPGSNLANSSSVQNSAANSTNKKATSSKMVVGLGGGGLQSPSLWLAKQQHFQIQQHPHKLSNSQKYLAISIPAICSNLFAHPSVNPLVSPSTCLPAWSVSRSIASKLVYLYFPFLLSTKLSLLQVLLLTLSVLLPSGGCSCTSHTAFQALMLNPCFPCLSEKGSSVATTSYVLKGFCTFHDKSLMTLEKVCYCCKDV